MHRAFFFLSLFFPYSTARQTKTHTAVFLGQVLKAFVAVQQSPEDSGQLPLCTCRQMIVCDRPGFLF